MPCRAITAEWRNLLGNESPEIGGIQTNTNLGATTENLQRM